MKKIALSLLSAASLATLVSPSSASLLPPSPTESAAIDYCAAHGCTVSGFTQVPWGTSGQRYESFDISFPTIGTKGVTKIGIHHLSPLQGIVPTQGNVVMLHGDLFNFETAFMEGSSSPPFLSMPGYLAGSGIDVWGIDLRWTKVPASQTSFGFMASWGIQEDAADVSNALGAIRSIRGELYEGTDPVNLLGWSRGGIIGYALLDAESQLPAAQRNVGGFIPVDIYLKTDEPALQLHACNRLAANLALVNGTTPQYEDNTGLLVSYTAAQVLGGQGAATCAHPVCAPYGLSNNDLAGLIGTATFSLMPDPFADAYHFTAGVTDTQADTFSLTYTDHDALLAMEAGAAPYQPLKLAIDTDRAICDDPAQPGVAFDDHLGDITVPVLYVGAAGGIGMAGEYTVSLLGSTDVTTYEISGGTIPQLEFGHADIFHTRQDPATTWEPIMTWLTSM